MIAPIIATATALFAAPPVVHFPGWYALQPAPGLEWEGAAFLDEEAELS